MNFFVRSAPECCDHGVGVRTARLRISAQSAPSLPHNLQQPQPRVELRAGAESAQETRSRAFLAAGFQFPTSEIRTRLHHITARTPRDDSPGEGSLTLNVLVIGAQKRGIYLQGRIFC